MRVTLRREFISSRILRHENPLGLPRSGTPPHWPRAPKKRRIAGVGKVLAVSSAKGGVGKSTIASNLSLSFARMGFRAGILDTDIFGPSIPTIFNLSGEPRLSENNQLLPLTNYGVKTMSMGYLVPEGSPVVWRGPMVMKAIQQLLHEVDWGGIDVLVLDLPPGTGDTQLTISQQVVLDGALIVSTPHTLALKDAQKGISTFEKLNVPILGLVQNMSLYTCPHCSTPSHVFGSASRTRALCDDAGIEFLGDVPLNPGVVEKEVEDGVRPALVAEPEGEGARVFMDFAKKVAGKIGLA
ncbi:hypothetical protein VUR80DRAFT_4178 [Thermomyces stellatus]